MYKPTQVFLFVHERNPGVPGVENWYVLRLWGREILKQKKILVLIPAFNEAENVLCVIQEIERHIPQADILVINDGSTDETCDVLRNNECAYLDLCTNLGIGGGMQAGYQYAVREGYDIVIQQDGDGQHDPAHIKDALQMMREHNADIVIGSRFINKNKEGYQSTKIRRGGIIFLNKLVYAVCGARVTDATSGYRIVNRKYAEMYAHDYPLDYPEPEAIVTAALKGANIVEIPVIMRERKSGRSSINLKRSIYYMIKVSMAIILVKLSHVLGENQ